MSLSNDDYIFDGFAHRRFDEKIDGWRNRLPSENDYPAVDQALQVISLFKLACTLAKRNWELEQQVIRLGGKP